MRISFKCAFQAGLLAIVGAIMVLFFAVVASAAPISQSAFNQQIDQTNFMLNDNCSATLIDAGHGYLLTANHCITAQFKIIEKQDIGKDGTVKIRKVRVSVPGTVSQLVFSGPDEVQRTSYIFTVKKNDADLDLALIQTKAKLPNREAAPIACAMPKRLDAVYAVGNPYAILYSSVTQGIVASVNRNYRMIGVDDQGDNGLIQSTAPIEGGNSGGALYNDAGELIGVNVRASQVNETVALAVPLTDIKAFLAGADLAALWQRCETKAARAQ